MKRLFMAAVAALVWASAVAGICVADTPVKCKLDLMRLDPLDTSKKDWREVFAFYNVDAQSFHRVTQKGHTVLDADGAFRKVVKKEPAKLHAENPLRGVAKLGSKLYGFVLDSIDDKSKGYDRLYFDLNGNGDLTDDQPIDVLPSKNRAAPSATYDRSEFPRVDLMIDVEGRQLPYSFFATRDYYYRPGYEYVTLSLKAAVYRRGDITLDGKSHAIAVLDWNSNGRFDDVFSSPKESHNSPAAGVKYGDMLLIDPEMLAKEDLSSSRPAGEHRQFVGKLTTFENKNYEVKVSPAGNELTWTPSPIACGQVVGASATCRASLISELGYVDLKLEKSKPASVPAGQWRLLSYTTTIENWKDQANRNRTSAEVSPSPRNGVKLTLVGATSEKAAPPEPLLGPASVSRLSAEGTSSGTRVTVKAGQTTTLKFGAPYKTVVTAIQRPGSAEIDITIQGADGEHVRELLVNGRRTEKPKVTITDPRGKVVAEGNLEYG
jgi:hypothetical protein